MKKHRLHDFVLGMVIVALLVALAVPALAVTGRKQMEVDNTDIHLHVDGIPVSVSPFASGGTTYLPVRAVGEALGMDVRWDGPTHTVYISDPTEPSTTNSNTSSTTVTGKQTIDVDYLDIKLVVNGKEVTPKDANGKVVEPFAYNGTTYLPVRAVGEALGKSVRWDGETKTVHLGELPQGTYLVDACKVALGRDSHLYRAANHEAFEYGGKRYSQGFSALNATFELGGKYESLTFDFINRHSSVNLWVYLDGECVQEIKGVQGGGVQTVTVPLNYARTISFRSSELFIEAWFANAVLHGERTVTKPVSPVLPANATYLADECKTSESDKYKATEGEYWEDIFGNKYTNGVAGDCTVELNGKYKTLKATVIGFPRASRDGAYCLIESEYTFSVDGETVKTIEHSAAMKPQTIEIPLNYGMELRISQTYNGGSEYIFFADAILE